MHWCQAQPKLPLSCCQFLRPGSLLTPVQTQALPTSLWLRCWRVTDEEQELWTAGTESPLAAGTGMPGVAVGCKRPCLVPTSSVPNHGKGHPCRLSPQPVCLGFGTRTPEEQRSDQARLGSVPSVCSFCLASWLCC